MTTEPEPCQYSDHAPDDPGECCHWAPPAKVSADREYAERWMQAWGKEPACIGHLQGWYWLPYREDGEPGSSELPPFLWQMMDDDEYGHSRSAAIDALAAVLAECKRACGMPEEETP